MLQTFLSSVSRRRRSVAGTLIKLSCLYGGYLIVFAIAAIYDAVPAQAATAHERVIFPFLLATQIQIIMETLFMTAALWFTGQIFDDLAARRTVSDTLITAMFRIGLFMLLATLPSLFDTYAAFMEHRLFPLQFDFLSFVMFSISICLVLIAWQVKRMRIELEEIV